VTSAKPSLGLASLLIFSASAAQLWTVRIEEPTGLYRRTNEAVAIPLDKLGGHHAGFTVTDPAGRELPWQVSAGELLFPVSLIPGELPLYKVACCDTKPAPRFTNPITLRRLGINRVEFGNDLFRAVVDLSSAAIVEAYSLLAGPQRSLNLVETSPETREGLSGDIHENSPSALQALPPPIPGVPGENSGWTTLGVKGPFTKIELLESGPIRGRLRLTRDADSWDISWNAASPAFRWKASRGFRFAAISALPYLPFNRCLGGSEYDGPTGPGEPEPTPNDIMPRPWPKLPGGHIVYYTREENYGALGILSLDPDLAWTGACSRRLLAQKPEGVAEIAVTFPAWQGQDTVLQARQENRVLRQPLLTLVASAGEGALDNRTPAPREPDQQASQQAPTPFRPDALPLDGEWQLAWAEKGQGPPRDGWRTVKVPGTAHVQWLDPAKLYTREAEWVSEKEWWYRRTFRTPAAFSGKRLRLQFEATDYYADTYLNGAYLGRHEGYIDPYEYDVTSQARPGNELLVRVWTPVSYYWKHRPYTVKGAYGAVDQKPDDITALGITRPVRLVASAGPIIQDVAINTRLTDKGAEVEVSLQSTAGDPRLTWELTLSPRNFTSPERIQVRASARASRLVIPVANPQLWWTWDHGKPNLYTLDIRLLNAQGQAVDGQSLAVGIREIEKIGWNFYLNRKKLFIRGTNYYYHLFMSEMHRSKYERDVKLMLGMNVNMIRVHCHFSNREFYDLADENGVLIWQDFLEAWYPHDRAFSLRAAALYDNHLRYVRNHASVALWATSDEEDLENYRDITKHLAPRPFYLDPQHRPVVRSTGRFGDAHIYHGWYDGSIWEYTGMTQPFVSELGATSLPNYETLIKFMPDQWPIRDHQDEWVWRRLQISEALRAWGDPAGMSLRDYIPQTQAYVARLFQIALERQRRRKRDGAGGILHFHAIDIWPSVTMAAIDIDRVPTKTYDTVRRSFAPVAALFEYDRDRWRSSETLRCGLWAVNDRWDPIPNATLRWKITGSAAGLPSGQFPVSLPADSVERLGTAEWKPSTPGAYQLHAEMLDAQGKLISENIYEFTVTP
jgi:beta-mannosidase